MSVILGPCPCQGCGRPVTWNGIEWQEPWGKRHSCNVGRGHLYSERMRYTSGAGVSGQSDIVADGRPPLLTPEVGRPLVSVE